MSNNQQNTIYIGDITDTSAVTIEDAQYILNWIASGGNMNNLTPDPYSINGIQYSMAGLIERANVTGKTPANININDAQYILNWIASGGNMNNLTPPPYSINDISYSISLLPVPEPELITLLNDGISSVNSQIDINHNPNVDHIFYAQIPGDPNNSGGYSGNGKIAVTMEAKDLLLTTANIDEIGINSYPYPTNINVSSGEYVNIYMVYLNNTKNFTSNYGEITFENEIIGLGITSTETLFFSDSRFSQQHYPTENVTNFNKRSFEPKKWNSGNYHNSWTKSSTENDWFKIINNNIFQYGCDNGKKGDFMRVVTKNS
jgi:hypothetical protein